MRRAEVRTVKWFFAAMGVLTAAFVVALVGHYLLGWW
jgi:hypothetical protein